MKIHIFMLLLITGIITGCSSNNSKMNLAPDEVIRRHIQALNEKDQPNAEAYLVKDRRKIINWQFGSQKSIRLLSLVEINDETFVKSYMETGRGSITHPEQVKVFKVEIKKEYTSSSIITEDNNIWYYYVIKQTNTSPWLIDDWGI